MSIKLHALPYDVTALGFYFETYDEYANKAAELRNSHGDPVEEFELQFIDGDDIDCALARAIGLSQANLKSYLEAAEEWDTDDKIRVILAVGECGYAFDADTTPEDFDIDIYPDTSLRELAENFVEQGLYGDIPERLAYYIDYDAIARDLSVDYAESEIAGTRLLYRCV